MPKQILDEPLYDLGLDEKQLRLAQLKKRCFVLWVVCVGSWTAIEVLFIYALEEYWVGEFRAMVPVLYLSLFIYIGMFTSVLLKPHKPKKELKLLWKIAQQVLVFVGIYTFVLICFVVATLLVGIKLSLLLGLSENWEIYLTFVLSSWMLTIGVYFFLKPELNYDVNNP